MLFRSVPGTFYILPQTSVSGDVRSVGGCSLLFYPIFRDSRKVLRRRLAMRKAYSLDVVVIHLLLFDFISLTKSVNGMAFGSDVRMCMWSDIPPISMGMAFKPRITPPIYWNMRGKSSLRIFLPLFFTWKILSPFQGFIYSRITHLPGASPPSVFFSPLRGCFRLMLRMSFPMDFALLQAEPTGGQ